MSSKLKMGASALALVAAASLFANAASAQTQVTGSGGADGSAAEIEEVVVTGSSIRGVAAVGSNLVSVGQQELQAVAAINATQLVNTVPAITNSGSAPQGENSFGYYTPTIHSLGGSASNTTLVLIDGMRMVGGGTQYAQTDPNIIPTTGIQRVEVLADGASSVYGSDAVAGVINFIGRSKFNGVELNARVGFGDSYRQHDIGVVAGQTWDRGSVFVAGTHAKQSTVDNTDRPFLSLGDYRFKGGTNTNSFNCSPATIRTPASGNNIYLSPSSTTAIAQIAANAPCNNSIYGAAIPGTQRDNLMMRATVDVTDRLTLTGTMIWNHLYGQRDGTPGTLTNVTVFGPGSGKGGQINPFFVAPAGDPNATQETINWLNLLSPTGKNSNGNETSQFYGRAEYDLGGEWTAAWSTGYGRSRSFQDAEDTFCGACAILALNGTGQTSGSTTATLTGGANVVALNLPLTAANALDVWNAPGAGNRTSAATLRSIFGNDSRNIHYNKQFQSKIELQGPLFALPAGELRMATGAEYLTQQQDVKTVGGTNIGPSINNSSYVLFNLDRNVWSGYVEFAVPVVSPEMNVPFVQEFDLSLSGRYDKYSDVGSTTNPKIAANWRPVSFMKLRGNWASAFVAPPQFAIGDPNLGYQRTANGAGLSGRITVPTTFFPEVRLVPGADCSAASSCDIGLPANQGLSRTFGAGLRGAKPQKGQSYSIGSDFNFTDFAPGLTASVTYFHNKLRGGVNALNFSQIVNTPSLKDHLVICPASCTPAQINAFTRVEQGARLNVTIPDRVYFLTDTDSGNFINLDVSGVDFLVNWRIPTENWGTFRLMTSGTVYTQYDQFIGEGGGVYSTLDSSGFNTTFPSLEVRTRSGIGWDLGGLSADLFINHTPSYHNYSSTSVAPVISNGFGPASGGDLVKADTTFDTTVSYEFGGGFLEGSSVYVNVTNLLDTQPPFYNGNTSGIGVGAWGFNGLVSNPIGRVISLGFRGRF